MNCYRYSRGTVTLPAYCYLQEEHVWVITLVIIKCRKNKLVTLYYIDINTEAAARYRKQS